MPDFKYTLTRYCLRAGQLTLPQSMLELFPSEGTFQAVDTQQSEELTLNVPAPRTIAGVGAFIKRHNLDVNDQILIRLRDDGGYAFTPLPHTSKPDYAKPETAQHLLDTLAEQGTPLSEAEIRALYPELSKNLVLADLFAKDARFTFRSGRWQTVADESKNKGEGTAEQERAPKALRVEETVAADAVPATVSTRDATKETSDKPRAEMPSANVSGTDVPHTPQPVPQQPSKIKIITPQQDSAKQERQPAESAKPNKRASVTPYPRGVMFPGDTGLNSREEGKLDLSRQQRTKALLTALGFRVEGLAHGQLLAHADLVRRHYSVLVHLMPERGSLDWAALLARRREVGATYAAVIGHQQDLTPFEGPAGMARASLWSWKALDRLEGVLGAVPLSPVDLESHFERDGLFDKGLKRFELDVQKRIAERGTFSAVLTRLADMKAPTVFMLDEAVDMDLTREQVLEVLESLSQAPFHLISKVDSGEFCLRYRVSDALLNLSDFALSLRDRLPSRRTERLQATASSLLTPGGGDTAEPEEE